MAPKPRDMQPGLFHVYTHCVWGVPHLFRDDTDRLEFLRHLARGKSRPGWACLQYCLMTSHHHLMVDVDEGVLPRAMHAINLAYARHYNRRYALRGHVQGWRYGSSRIVGDADLIQRFAYIANNPVEAGLCAAPADWPWSSYAATIGLAELPTFIDPARILRCFGDSPDVDARAALRKCVEKS